MDVTDRYRGRVDLVGGVVVGSMIVGLLLGDGKKIAWQCLVLGGFAALLALLALPTE